MRRQGRSRGARDDGGQPAATGYACVCGLLCLVLAPPLYSHAQVRSEEQHRPAPVERRTPATTAPAPRAQGQAGQNTGQGRLSGQHLAQWMDSHRDLPLAQQQRALELEPGFRQLQPQVQQRMHQRLEQLNTMSPEQRQRVIERTEQMERLTVPERQQVRGALGQLGSLPQDRRRAVARSFRAIQAMPEQERQSYLNSPQFRSQFNDQERGTLNNLLQVAPMLPTASGPAAPPR